MIGAMPRRFHRIVGSDPPTLDDFTSDAARGRLPLRTHPEAVRLASGLSVFATVTQARAKARQYPFLGAYVALIEIGDGGPGSLGANAAGEPRPPHGLGRPRGFALVGGRGCTSMKWVGTLGA